MSDTLVGVLGALVVVGGMMVVFETQIQGSAAGGDDGADVAGIAGPPPVLGTDSWSATGCQVLALRWTPALSALAPFVAPYDPAPGPVPGRGLFVIEGMRCPDTAVSGLDDGEHLGVHVFALVHRPGEGAPVADRFFVSLERVGFDAEGLAPALARHGFGVTEGTTSFSVTDVAFIGRRATLGYETAQGAVEASATLTGSAGSLSERIAFLASTEEQVGSMVGSRRGAVTGESSATVQASGDTWVARLSLEPVPFQVAYRAAGSFELVLASAPISGAAN